MCQDNNSWLREKCFVNRYINVFIFFSPAVENIECSLITQELWYIVDCEVFVPPVICIYI